jgi:tetratricopeptide (TPR) repeat protein
VDEAIAYFKKSIAFAPKLVNSHIDLGKALAGKGKPDEAIACFRKAIAFDPKDALAHTSLGVALAGKGKVEEAIACFRKAIEIDPRFAQAHYNLGVALEDKGRPDEAIACYRKAIARDPKLANAHLGLALGLLQKGQFIEARQPIRRCLRLLPTNHPLRKQAFQLRRYSDQMIALDKKLPAILKGEAKAANADEQLSLGRLCMFKKRYTAASRFYADAFAAQPTLADDLQAGHRYNAACSAALAAGGQGRDAPKPDDKERARLRKQALGWLQADLALWGKEAEKGTPQARAAVQKKLRHWQKDSDLAGVRDAALVKLPEAERAEWQQLWGEVEALRKKQACSRLSCTDPWSRGFGAAGRGNAITRTAHPPSEASAVSARGCPACRRSSR